MPQARNVVPLAVSRTTQPSWQHRWLLASSLCGQVRGPLHQWLLDKSSLTSRLMAKSGGRLTVQVLHQGWGQPTLSEARALRINPRSAVLVREVLLCGDGEPWVFARSILPYSSLKGRLRHLGKFDNRPLGAFLFSQPNMRRGPMEVSKFGPHCNRLPAHLQDDEPAWGRRSVFYVADKPLLVSEVFLKTFVERL